MGGHYQTTTRPGDRNNSIATYTMYLHNVRSLLYFFYYVFIRGGGHAGRGGVGVVPATLAPVRRALPAVVGAAPGATGVGANHRGEESIFLRWELITGGKRAYS
eukprot:3036777-Pyramimonas_sp.AAC.1